MEEIEGLRSDDELTISDLSLYAAGQLGILYGCVDKGLMTMQEVADLMEMDINLLRVNRCMWNIGGILTQADTVKSILVEQAEREKNKK